MTKSRDSPIAGASRRSSRAQSEWKVESQTWRQSSPSDVLDALAHLLGGLVRERDREHLVRLRVAGRHEVGDADVMTRVLPEPAPARISSGPSVWSTAALGRVERKTTDSDRVTNAPGGVDANEIPSAPPAAN